ncbi:bifunctional P-450:NADPH-P450 reductase [Annulohypoxylon maeteangense]|uniref:bifunctional P-450:NADPH-P450 reductase n=1 Tax=Annulohypoxylon maeteangense TaxID=1927788 RepID=UPI002007F4AE|nr:bifunctional P-450:NADPH-P450 reductase [Annulohypoxylon maeteangense]KAI0880913.1 bifunctional P-450:NADPH-P450 reductase [Annulohypoxylon maeteangense]
MATVPIPEPPRLPFIGNIADIDAENSIRSFKALTQKYGEIYRISLPGTSLVFVNTRELVDQACDEKKFKKVPNNVLQELKAGLGDGLFTAKLEAPNWGIAHRILMPAFGPIGIRNMFDEMKDIGSQLALKWARQGPHKRIHATQDFTRLTLDTIALCSMGFRFNSFYSDKMHPFVDSMTEFLLESGRRTQRLPLPAFLYQAKDKEFKAYIDVMRETADEVLKERIADVDSTRNDLLTAMLKGRDPVTGEKMSDQSIIDNLITFLVAGHETTSGTLSYAMYRLIANPDEYRKVQREVDEVVGKGPITAQHMSKLPYISAVLRETLRLDSPIALFGVCALEDTLLSGKYPVRKGEFVQCFLTESHLDPAVFEDPLVFKPERMLDENFNKLPKNSWKPFGNGARACIGRPFAWQEAVLVMAILFQNFNFAFADSDYELAHKQTLTIKPDNFFIRAILRDGQDAVELEHRLAGTEAPSRIKQKASSGDITPSNGTGGKRVTVLYGSNSGTCENMAQRLAMDAVSHGYEVKTLDCMDAAVERLPKNEPIVIITASYEGQPPDNAAHFVSWINSIEDKLALQGSSYAVFGCGHHDWAQTFHRVPKLVDQRLEELGATRIADIGFADAAGEDMFVSFETWEDSVLWPALDELRAKEGGETLQETKIAPLKVQVSNMRSSMQKNEVEEGKVIATRILTADGEPVKKHVDIRLPAGLSYRPGDYLTVLPVNPKNTVQRAMRRFGLSWDSTIKIEGAGTRLPTNELVPAHSILSGFVELAQPATRRTVLVLADEATNETERATLKILGSDNYDAEIIAKRVSILDLLETYPSIDISLGSFLTMLPQMRVRQYSISSSPLDDPTVASITFSLISSRANSGRGEYLGVASSYLSSLEPEDRLRVSVRSSHMAFHLPSTPEKTPLILVAAGTGIAPFRGFVQERAAMVQSGRKVAPTILYHGCRERGKDDLYAAELVKWEEMGAVTVRRAYSRKPKEAAGLGYVQDLLWADRENFMKMWRAGAVLYVCGSRRVSKGVEKIVKGMRQEDARVRGEKLGDEEVQKWWDEGRNVRYATDVFD